MKATFNLCGISYSINAESKDDLIAVLSFISNNIYDAMQHLNSEGYHATADWKLEMCREYWSRIEELKG